MGPRAQLTCAGALIGSAAYFVVSSATGYLQYKVLQGLAVTAILFSAVVVTYDRFNQWLNSTRPSHPHRVRRYRLDHTLNERFTILSKDFLRGLTINSKLRLPEDSRQRLDLEIGARLTPKIRLFPGDEVQPVEGELPAYLEQHVANPSHSEVLQSVTSPAWLQQISDIIETDGRLNGVFSGVSLDASLIDHEAASMRFWLAGDSVKVTQVFAVRIQAESRNEYSHTAQLTVDMTINSAARSIISSSLSLGFANQ